jgi:hypothetical protein
MAQAANNVSSAPASKVKKQPNLQAGNTPRGGNVPNTQPKANNRQAGAGNSNQGTTNGRKTDNNPVATPAPKVPAKRPDEKNQTPAPVPNRPISTEKPMPSQGMSKEPKPKDPFAPVPPAPLNSPAAQERAVKPKVPAPVQKGPVSSPKQDLPQGFSRDKKPENVFAPVPEAPTLKKPEPVGPVTVDKLPNGANLGKPLEVVVDLSRRNGTVIARDGDKRYQVTSEVTPRFFGLLGEERRTEVAPVHKDGTVGDETISREKLFGGGVDVTTEKAKIPTDGSPLSVYQTAKPADPQKANSMVRYEHPSPKALVGQLPKGTKTCAALIQAEMKVPLTDKWEAGPRISEKTPPGTAVATFDPDPKGTGKLIYLNKDVGNHAAILEKFDPKTNKATFVEQGFPGQTEIQRRETDIGLKRYYEIRTAPPQ